MALVKMLALALSTFMGGVGVLRVSILYESYVLLAWGVMMSLVGFLLVFALPTTQDHPHPAGSDE